jgi:outer membrane protein OmpA-like peptidoglycan-associated protein
MRMASMSAETLPPISPVLQWPYEEIPNVPGELEAFRRVQRLSFPAGSNQINDEGRGALLEALPALKTNTRWHLLVVGFTDRGTETTRARELSLARAETVKDWLLANGIEADCVTFSGFGSRYAEGDEYKPDTTASDRRVEIWAFMR